MSWYGFGCICVIAGLKQSTRYAKGFFIIDFLMRAVKVEFKAQHRIVFVYLVLSTLWIFLSDFGIDFLFDSNEAITFAQNIKGSLFIAVTGVLLFYFIERALGAINKKNKELVESYEQTLSGWVQVMDLRHKEIKDHSQRVTQMTVELAKIAGITKKDKLNHIKYGATLHDIGKISIPDAILIKPGNLNDEEWEQIKMHPEIGRDILSKIDFLQPCLDIPYCHHEKWDGSGYPQGLKGEEIPIAARIFAVVDVWDALIHPRVYKSAWPEKEVLQYIEGKAGKHFDPEIVNLFLGNYKRLKMSAIVS